MFLQPKKRKMDENKLETKATHVFHWKVLVDLYISGVYKKGL